MPIPFTPIYHDGKRFDSLEDFLAVCDERQELIDREKDCMGHPHVRRCPLCEDAAYGNDDLDDECEIHGDPYESPYEAEIMYERLFGSLPEDVSTVKRCRIREWQRDFPMPESTRRKK